MKEIPKWIIKVIEKEDLVCGKCKIQFTIENLMSIGIHESTRSPHLDTLCIGMMCSECNELIIFEIKEMSLIDFAFEMLDKETSNKVEKKTKKDTVRDIIDDLEKGQIKRRKKKRVKKSNITLEEVKEVRKFLETKDLSHEDFLMALGMLPEEIDKYNYKK